LDLVPVLSWLALRGRCRHCSVSIGTEPIIIELANTTLFGMFGLKFAAHAVVPAYWVLAGALVARVWIDLHEFRLPREITYTAFVISTILMMNAALLDGEPGHLWKAFIGAGIALVIMLVIYLASRGGMGDGDVRLAPLL